MKYNLFLKLMIAANILLSSGCLSSANLSSASAMSLSLNESIDLALRNDESVASAEFGRESAKWNLSAVRRQTGATLYWSSQAYKIGGRDYRASREAHKNYGNTGSRIYDEDGNYLGFANGSTAYNNTFTNSLEISVPFYTGGRLEGNIKARRYAVNSADLSLENTRQTLKYQVTEAYYNILQHENQVQIHESAVHMSNEQLNLLQVQYEEGERAYSEVLQMQVEVANYNQNLVNARSNLEVAKSTFLSLIELPEDTPVDLTDKFVYNPFNFTLEECLSYAHENRPDLAAAVYNVNQTEAAVSSEKSGFRPTVTGSANKTISANGAFQSERSEQWQAGLVVRWNIFDNQVTSASVKAAQSEVERAKANLDAVEKSVALQVRSAYTQMRAAEENVRLTKIAAAQAEESYNIAVIRHNEGVDILLNVTDAQEKLTQARTNYSTALYQYNLYKAQLDKAMGIPVGFNVPLYVEAEQEGKSSDKALEVSAIN